jgi:hypothetical protein
LLLCCAFAFVFGVLADPVDAVGLLLTDPVTMTYKCQKLCRGFQQSLLIDRNVAKIVDNFYSTFHPKIYLKKLHIDHARPIYGP